jgi:hypothetical protein
MGGVCSVNGGEEARISVIEGKPERKRSLGRPRPRWVGNIKIEFLDIAWGI